MNPLAMMMGGGGNNPLAQIAQLKQMLTRQNPEAFAQALAQRNPQFAQFVQQNKGKTAEQVAKENGLDWSQIQSLL
jgi:hypothetical protein